MDWQWLGIALVGMNSLVLGFSLMALAARKWLIAYGECKITVNSAKELRVTGGDNLLTALSVHKHFIPSACGGKGTCGFCRVKIPAGGGPILPTEKAVLLPKEIREGLRLACQVRVRRDVELVIPREYLAIREFQGEISRIVQVNDSIRKLFIRLLAPPTIGFKPGQYVQIGVEQHGEMIYRGYSLANPPGDGTQVEVNVLRVEDGILSTYLHFLQEGQQVTFTGPYGDFFLQEKSSRTVVCVAGGIGLAPMKAIIGHLQETASPRRVFLYYGARHRSFLYDHDLFSALARKCPDFVYVPALSEPAEGDDWTGETGLITEVFRRHYPGKLLAEAYVCGPPAMLSALFPLLEEKGISRDGIFFDRFTV